MAMSFDMPCVRRDTKPNATEDRAPTAGLLTENPIQMRSSGPKTLNTMLTNKPNLAILKPKRRFLHIANPANKNNTSRINPRGAAAE